MALRISRKYDFKPGTKIYSAQMDEELNQLVDAHNSVVTDKADKTGVLEKTNTEVFTPTENYQPATKKYVDESIGAVVLGQLPDGSVTKAKLSETVQASVDKADGSVQQTDKATTEEADAGVEDSHFMTPAKVMKVVKDHDYQVGDVKVTRRINLGDDWLLCNGEQFDDTIYPNLAAMYSKTNVLRSVYSASGHKLVYANGYWFLLPNTTTFGHTITLYYSQHPDQGWTTLTITNTHTNNWVDDVIYANGYWMFCGRAADSAVYHYYATVYYSNSLTGTFASVDVIETDNYAHKIVKLSYTNGKFILAAGLEAGSGSGLYISYSTTPTGWSAKIAVGSVNSIAHIAPPIWFNNAWRIYVGTTSGGSYGFSSTNCTTWSQDAGNAANIGYPDKAFIRNSTLYVLSRNLYSWPLAKSTDGITFSAVYASIFIHSIFVGDTYAYMLRGTAGVGNNSTFYIDAYPSLDDLLSNSNKITTVTWQGSYTVTVYYTEFNEVPVGEKVFVEINWNQPGTYCSRIGNDALGFAVPLISSSGVYTYIRGKMS